MKDYLKNLPAESRDLIHRASEQASRKKIPVYLVGGFVRDLILGVKNFDLDIVVEGDGIAFADDLANSLRVKIVRHRRFGTATLHVKPHLKVDIATVRREYYPKPGHLPVVEPGVLREDLFRRDFTVNAMAIDISRDNYGVLIDFFAGKRDLQQAKVRVLHEGSFLDDPTRILRAVRFEQRFKFRIEPATLGLIKEAAKLDMLARVDRQRIRDDLILLLKEEQPARNIRRLSGLTGFSFLSPHLRVGKRTYSLLSSIEKQLRWYKKLYSGRRMLDGWLVYFMGLTESLSEAQLKYLMRSSGFKKSAETRVLDYRALSRKKLFALRKKNLRPSAIYSFLEPLSYETILMIKAAHKDPRIRKHIDDFFEIYNGMRISISGHDVHALGMKPGPVYQKIFGRVLHAKLDGEVKNRDEEIALIKKIVKKC